MNTRLPPHPAQGARVIHLALLGGLVLVSAMFLLLARGAHLAPMIPAGSSASMMGYLLAACSLATISIAFLGFKPRIPARSSGQSDDTFWQGALPPAIAMWAVIEGGGILAAVGALLTGQMAPAFAVAIAIGCLAIVGPGRIENG